MSLPTYTDSAGDFSPGESECRWLFTPPQRITLYLSNLRLPEGAQLYAFDGTSAYTGAEAGTLMGAAPTDGDGNPLPRSPLLAILNTTSLYVPPIEASAAALFLELVLPDEGQRDMASFDATYHSGRCQGTVNIPTLHGVVSDGSEVGKTQGGDFACSWVFHPEPPPDKSVSGMIIVFDRLQTVDYFSSDIIVYVYEIDADGKETLVFSRGSSDSNRPDYIEASGKKVRITLTGTSRSGVRATSGFSARYYTLYTGVACPDYALPLVSAHGTLSSLGVTTLSAKQSCRWLFSTPQNVNLYLSNVRLPVGATLTVYSGDSAYVGGQVGGGIDSPKTNSFGDRLPPAPRLLSLNKSVEGIAPLASGARTLLLELHFNSDVSGVVNVNFDASYFAGACGGQVDLSVPSATFTDGTEPASSVASSFDCYWLLSPRNASALQVEFPRLSTDKYFSSRKAEMYVYDGTSIRDTLIFSRTTSDTTPVAALASSSGSLLVRFYGIGSSVSTGFEAVYSSDGAPLPTWPPATVETTTMQTSASLGREEEGKGGGAWKV